MLKIVPDTIFKTRIRDESIGGDNPFRWQDVSTDDIFKGKNCVFLAIPGAFTPTCSSKHLPGYDTKYQEFIDLGVDDVYCLSVNGANIWASSMSKCCPTEMATLPGQWGCW